MLMTAEQFTASVDRTFQPDHPIALVACGMAGEAGELLELDLLTQDLMAADAVGACTRSPAGMPGPDDWHNEMGDLHWYIAAACRKLGSSYVEVWRRPVTDCRITGRKHTAASLSVLVSKVVDKIKKVEWHAREELRSGLLDDLAGIIFASCDVSHGRLEYSWEANHEKLLKRYPDGFVKGGGIR